MLYEKKNSIMVDDELGLRWAAECGQLNIVMYYYNI